MEHVDSPRRGPESRRRAWREIVLYGLACGLLTVALEAGEYRLLMPGSRAGLHAAGVAVLFVAVGLFLGARLQPAPAGAGAAGAIETSAEALPPAPSAAAPQAGSGGEPGLTPRELETLGLIAEGLSNREIAERLGVSENTVKTHSSRVFDKLGARRRTQAVQVGKKLGLIA